MKKLTLIILAISLCILATGCATKANFGPLPNSQEFSKPVSILIEEYPELTKHESYFAHMTIFGLPKADELLAIWGKPTYSRLSWLNLMPFNLVPPIHPLRYWRWEIEDKQIHALIDYPLAFSYKPHVVRMKIREVNKDEKFKD